MQQLYRGFKLVVTRQDQRLITFCITWLLTGELLEQGVERGTWHVREVLALCRGRVDLEKGTLNFNESDSQGI